MGEEIGEWVRYVWKWVGGMGGQWVLMTANLLGNVMGEKR